MQKDAPQARLQNLSLSTSNGGNLADRKIAMSRGTKGQHGPEKHEIKKHIETKQGKVAYTVLFLCSGLG